VAGHERNFKYLEMLQHLHIMNGYFREVMREMGNYIKGVKVWKLDSVMDTVTQYAILEFVMRRPLKDENNLLPSSLKKIST
jgi:hypothetical protein